MVEILMELDYLEVDIDSELYFLSEYLNGKKIDDFNVIKEKLGEDFNRIKFDPIKTLDSLKSDYDDRDEMLRYLDLLGIHFLFNQHPDFSGHVFQLFHISDVERILLDFNPDLFRDVDYIIHHVINLLDPYLTSINTKEFLEKLKLGKGQDHSPFAWNKEERGCFQIAFLFERKSGYLEEFTEYMLSLLLEGRVKRFCDFVLRIPKQRLKELDFKNLSLLPLVTLYIETYDRERVSSPYTMNCVKDLEELCKIWNGPSLRKSYSIAL